MGDGISNIVLGTGKGPVALTSGDFNNDGHPDLAVADSLDGTITLFLSNPNNNFTYYTVKTLSGFGMPNGIVAGQFHQVGQSRSGGHRRFHRHDSYFDRGRNRQFYPELQRDCAKRSHGHRRRRLQ